MGAGRGRRVDLSERNRIVDLVVTASQNGCRIHIACKDLEIGKKTFERWRDDKSGDGRKGPITRPANKLTEDEKMAILSVVNSKQYYDLPATQIVPRLADEGKYLASESSIYRILKSEGLNAHRGNRKAPKNTRPEPKVATGPGQVWSWDITYLKSPVKGQFFYLYMIIDLFSRKIVGQKVYDSESMEHSSELVRTTCIREKINKNELVLHSDNGGPMKGATMLVTLTDLGVEPSLSRPRVSNDNPFSESLFSTMKGRPVYSGRPFESIEAAQLWVNAFVTWYNDEHRHSGIKFVTPSSRHAALDKALLEKRDQVYKAAKLKNPNRWSKETRDWNWIEKVSLNSLQNDKKEVTKKAA